MSQNVAKTPTGAAHVDLPQHTKVDAEAMLERENSLHQPLKEGEPHAMDKGTTTRSPICNVPDDIMHHIFSFYLIDIDRIPINKSTQPSVLLSHVCASWRSLVLTHTQYWHKFLICTPSIPHCKDQYDINPLLKIVVPGGYEEALKLFRRRMQHICSLTQAFLERSGTSTLTITLSVWCSDGLMQTEEETRTYAHEYTSLVKLLCGESSRWGVCNFELCNSYSVEPAMRMILNLKAKDVPTLTHMGLAARHVTPHDECGVFVGSCVRSLDLKSGSRPWSQMRVNWATLTDLCYKGFNQHSETGGGHNDGVAYYFGPRSALSLLRLCGSLVTCEFEIEGQKAFPYQDYVYPGPEEEDILESPLQLKNLHSLSIEGHLFDRETLDALTLPSLTALHLLDVEASDPGRLFPWIGKYGESLTSFEVTLDDFDAEDIGALLQCVPRLRSLQLRCSCYDEPESVAAEVFKCLSPQFSDNGGLNKMPHCPDLRRFEFAQDSEAFHEHDVVRFVSARRPPLVDRNRVSLIEDVEVHFPRVDGVNIRGLLLERGVDVGGLTLRLNYLDPGSSISTDNDYEAPLTN